MNSYTSGLFVGALPVHVVNNIIAGGCFNLTNNFLLLANYKNQLRTNQDIANFFCGRVIALLYNVVCHSLFDLKNPHEASNEFLFF